MFAAQVSASTMRDIQSAFLYGLDGDLTARCDYGDGVTAYWALLAKFRPLDSTYRQDVENWLDRCWTKFKRYDGSILTTVAEIKKYVVEAKMTGVRVKWHKTGKRWIAYLV